MLKLHGTRCLLFACLLAFYCQELELDRIAASNYCIKVYRNINRARYLEQQALYTPTKHIGVMTSSLDPHMTE